MEITVNESALQKCPSLPAVLWSRAVQSAVTTRFKHYSYGTHQNCTCHWMLINTGFHLPQSPWRRARDCWCVFFLCAACTSMSVCKNNSDKLKLINYLFRENKTPCEIVALHAAHIFLLILHPAQKHNLTISFISPTIVSSVSCAFMHCLPLSQLYCSTLF